MIPRHPIRSLASSGVVAFGLLASCGLDRSAGNNGTSTDNVLTAVVVSIDSAAFGQVRPDTGAYPLLLRLNGGHLDFQKTLPGGADLRVQLDDSNALPFQVREWSIRENFGSVLVRVPRHMVWTSRRLVLYTGEGVRFNLSDSASTWNGVSNNLRTRLTTTTLADFEQDSLYALLACNCNHWYTGLSDSALQQLPILGKTVETALETDTLGPRSRVIHMRFRLLAPSKWVLIGTNLGTRFQRMNLLDSITFRARGNATLRIALEDRSTLNDTLKAWAPVTIDSVWRQYRVRPVDFLPPGTLSVGWDSIRTRVTTFTIFGMGGTDAWIDDIRFHGVGEAELR